VPSHMGTLAPPGEMTELVHFSANPSPQPKQQINRFSHFLHSHRAYRGMPSPSKVPLPMEDLYPHLIHGFLGPPDPASQTASRSVQLFLQSSGQKSLYFIMGDPFPQIAPSHGGSGPNLIHDSSGPSKSTAQTGSQSVHPFLHR